MKYLIFDTLAAAEARNLTAFTDGQQAGAFVPGTTAYSQVIRHHSQELYAVPVHPLYLSFFTPEEQEAAQPLSPDWFTMPE